MKLNLVRLFPSRLNLSGDGGNICVLKKRCRLRGIEVQETLLEDVSLFSPSETDLLYLGNGGEATLAPIARELMKIQKSLQTYRDMGGVILATGNTYPMLGKEFYAGKAHTQGLSLLDITTSPGEQQLIGNIAVNGAFGIVAGFENHTGKTRLGPSVSPLGTVITGHGNNGDDRTEGAIYKNIYATYLTGPLLPKNPELADLLIAKAIERKYNEFPLLAPLPNTMENQAKGYVLNYGNRTHK